MGSGAFVSPNVPGVNETALRVLAADAIRRGACAGLGAALGEVVPFFVARCARASGRDPLAALFGADGAPEALSPRSRKLVEVATRAGKG